MADLNADQVPDLAVANSWSDDIAVLLGIGDGTFATAVLYDAGEEPRSLSIADLNGDRVPDLVTGNSGSDDVAVLLGAGHGTFSEPAFYGAGDRPWSVAIADLNGDQAPDLVVASPGTNPDPGAVAVLLGNGDGTFSEAAFHGAGQRPVSVAIADLNGDQVPDLAVANTYSYPHPAVVAVLLGVGDGTFAAATFHSAGEFPQSVAAGDLNGDQVPDLAVASQQFSGEGNLAVLLGVGDGTFAEASFFPTGGIAVSVTLGDLDGDQVPDAAVANQADWRELQAGSVAVLVGTGDGSFAAASFHGAGYDPRSVAIGDLNGDQVPDLAVPVQTRDLQPEGKAAVFLGLGGGNFAEASLFGTGRGPSSVAIGDLNSDQVPDLAVTNSSSRDVAVMLGIGDGSFLPATFFSVGVGLGSVAIGDLNGDLVPELAVTGATAVAVLLGTGGGNFATPVFYSTGGPPAALAIGDLNGDQVPDLAVANFEITFPEHQAGSVGVLLGLGDATFGPPSVYAAGYGPRSVAIGDLNGDHVPDLAVANAEISGPHPEEGSVAVLLGSGDGTFGAPSLNWAGRYPLSVAIGDLNGDRLPDLAVADWLDPHNRRLGNAVVLLGHGDGTFATGILYGVGDGPASVAIGDLDGDSIPDLVLANYLSDNVAVLLGIGDGTFGAATLYGVGAGPPWVAIGDLDGDRMPELVVPNLFSDNVAVLRRYAPFPTPVELVRLDVRASGSGVVIRWTAAAERSSAGYHIRRGTAPEFGDAVRVNGALIAAGRRAYTFTDPLVPPGYYWYWLEEVSRSGASRHHGPQDIVVSPPLVFLAQNRPNPFTEATEIVFSTPVHGPVDLGIYDVSGRLVRRLVAEDAMSAGEHRVSWDGTGETGRPVASGVYLYRLQVGDRVVEEKLHLLR